MSRHHRPGTLLLHAHHGPLDVIEIVEVGPGKAKHYKLRARHSDQAAGPLVMYVPVDRLDSERFRQPIDASDLAEIQEIITSRTRAGKESFSRRYKNNESRLASNDPFLTAQVVRDLSQRGSLSMAERTQLRDALRVLNAEIEAVTGQPDALNQLVEAAVAA